MMLIPRPGSDLRYMSNTGSSAASVFPLAVGAMRSTFSPSSIGLIALSCGGVGSDMPSISSPDLILAWSTLKTLGCMGFMMER